VLFKLKYIYVINNKYFSYIQAIVISKLNKGIRLIQMQQKETRAMSQIPKDNPVLHK